MILNNSMSEYAASLIIKRAVYLKEVVTLRGKYKRHKLERRDRRLGYLLLIPPTVFIIIISILPLLDGIYIGMTNQNFIRPDMNDFVGFANYAKLLKDKEFLSAVSFSLFYGLCTIIVGFVLALIMALLLNRDIKGRGLFRALTLIPWVIAPSVAVTNWQWVLNDQFGIINTTLMKLHLVSEPVLFLADKDLVWLTATGVSIWRALPFLVVTLLSGLQGIPGELYEAAHMDGAGFFARLRSITLPMLKNVIFISTTLMFIWTINNFEMVWLLTRGGPNGKTFTLPIFSYYTAFFRNNSSYASAAATLVMILILILTSIYLFIQRDREY